MESVMCNLCGSSESSLHYQLADYLLERQDVITTLVKCNLCGLIYQNPRPTLAEMGAHYPQNYEPYKNDIKEKRLTRFSKQTYEYGMRKRWRLVTQHKRDGRLLDLGCATGGFLRGMKARGNWQVYGVDVSEHAISVAREYTGLNTYCGTLKEASFSENYLDVITMWDVFEHLHNPMATLRESYRILKPYGLLVIRVPNANSWNAALFGQYWSGLDAPRHLYIFSADTLSNMLVSSGFVKVSVNGCKASYMMFLQDIGFQMVAKNVPLSQRKIFLKALHYPVVRLLTFPLSYFVGLGLKSPSIVVTAFKL